MPIETHCNQMQVLLQICITDKNNHGNIGVKRVFAYLTSIKVFNPIVLVFIAKLLVVGISKIFTTQFNFWLLDRLAFDRGNHTLLKPKFPVVLGR